MNFNMNMELVKTIGRGTWKYGKLVAVEGLKAVALQGAGRVLSTAMDKGPKAIKELTFDEIVGVDKESKMKKLFNKRKKKEAEELLDEVSIANDEHAVTFEDTKFETYHEEIISDAE